MQATARISDSQPGPSYHLADREKLPNINRPKEKSYSASGRCNDFLTSTLTPQPPASVTVDYYDPNHNYITQGNYLFLRDSYFRYAELLGAKALHKVGKTIGESIANLYDEMNALTGDDLVLNIEPRGDQLCFTLWKMHRWGNYTLYLFPVKFVEKLPTQLRRITISFLHQFMKSNGINTMSDEYDTEIVLDWIEEGSESHPKDEQKRILEQVESYRTGKIYRLLEQVKKRCYFKRLSAAFEKYTPQNDFEHELLTLMREGLQFIGDDKPSIMSYAYDPEYREDADFRPLDLDRQIRIIYDDNDEITESLIETFNCDLRETYEIVPITILALSPKSQQTFSMDDYPERFFEWADKFINLLN